MSTFTNFLAALPAAFTPAQVASAVQALGTSLSPSWSSKATSKLHQIASVSSNPLEVAKLALDIDEIPGIPATVVAAANMLATPNLTQLQIIELIPAVETAITTG
jgi:hypothetical protein